MISYIRQFAIFGALIFASGCSIGSSMRVDVEVYKGPLSKTAVVQEQELCAKVADSGRVIEQQLRILNAFVHHEPSRKPPFRVKRFSVACEPDCEHTNQLRSDLGRAANLLARIDLTTDNCIADERQIKQFSAFGAELRDRASNWSAVQSAGPAWNKHVRQLVNSFAIFAAEYGNQIVSRADALLAQRAMSDEAVRTLYDTLADAIGDEAAEQYPSNLDDLLRQLTPAQRLATSIYLRDSNPTAYRNLLDWNGDASTYGPGGLSNLDRVRMAEELMRDEYWSNINTVHASGVGETRMALIKDDIGNWNLKSFSNDPTELINAYNNVARAAASEAISLAATGGGAKAAEKISRADQLLSLSNRALVGETREQPTIGTANLDDLRSRVRARLEEEQSRLKESLDGSEAAKGPRARLGEAKDSHTAASGSEAAATTEIEKQQEKIDDENIEGNDRTQEDRAAACANVVGDDRQSAGAVRKSCELLREAIAERNVAREKKAQSAAAISALEAEIKKLEQAAIARARLLLRDHGAVLSALQEALTPPQAQAAE